LPVRNGKLKYNGRFILRNEEVREGGAVYSTLYPMIEWANKPPSHG
jgi:hypothetical protein